jgi:hypothetical protein
MVRRPATPSAKVVGEYFRGDSKLEVLPMKNTGDMMDPSEIKVERVQWGNIVANGKKLTYCRVTAKMKLKEKKQQVLLAKKNGGMGNVDIPRNLEITPKMKNIFRFVATAAVAPANITYGDVLGICGGVCSVTLTTLKLIATSARIIKIWAWPPANGVGSNPSTCELNWVAANSDQNPDFGYSEAIPSGMNVPHPIITTPPKNSLAADWFSNAVTLADVLFSIATGQGTVIDILMEYTTPNNFASTSITTTAAVLGTFYYLALNHSGAKTLTPAALPSTA